MTKTTKYIIGCLNEIFEDVDMDKHRDAYETIRNHLLVSQANTLPLDEAPDGWLVDKLSQEDDGWFCCLVKPASPFSDEAYYAYSQEHGEVINISSPTEALRAAIAKVKS